MDCVLRFALSVVLWGVPWTLRSAFRIVPCTGSYDSWCSSHVRFTSFHPFSCSQTVKQPPWHPFLICYTNNVSPFVRLALVVLPPYLVFISICIGVVLTGLYRPSSVVSSLGLYCTIVDMDSVFSVPVFCAVFMVLILILNLGTLVQYCWRWYALMKVNPLFSRSTSLNIWLRVFIFSLYSFATLGACLTLIFDKRSPVSYVVQAGLPPVALLIFGSQKDMWHAACFWRTESAERKMSDGGWSAPVDTISTSTVGIESSIV
ncbi:unnamed protein product [Somion occarium]|uniref:Uncharacterized protein n=1 Tax=Somion occarium TaxID=3059160 RepID=A0ABP1CH56_9APHY